MTSEEEERPSFVTGGYGRHRRQWVNKNITPYFVAVTRSCRLLKVYKKHSADDSTTLLQKVFSTKELEKTYIDSLLSNQTDNWKTRAFPCLPDNLRHILFKSKRTLEPERLNVSHLQSSVFKIIINNCFFCYL